MKRLLSAIASGVALLALLAGVSSVPVDTVSVSGDPDLDAKVERALDQGLAYLARELQPDGSYGGQFGTTTAIPALAGMAFLARGHLPGDARYGEFLNRVADYVLSRAKPDTAYMGEYGGGKMYAHCISTLFLSEISGMVDPARQEKIDGVLSKAVALILKAQNVKKQKPLFEGGWRYSPSSPDSDMSCSGWALMALRSARLNGGAVPTEAIDRAVAYVRRHQEPTSGGFGYTGPGGSTTLTGAGILCLELCGRHDDPATRKATAYLLKQYTTLPKSNQCMYGVYYASQGLFQVGGDAWKQYAEWMYRYWISRQRPDGSWDANGKDSVPYQTSMVLLAFAVPYRQLPIYQRDETVDADE
jgi:hypothetical protein